MNKKKIMGVAAFVLPLAAAAQLHIGFETPEAYTNLGVYDAWEESPFRNGTLQGNVKVITNELNQEEETLGCAPNASAKMLAVQCSRFGSNTFGARIDLAEPFELTTTARYVHVLLNKPTEGRVMLIGLGKRTDRVGQSAETEQFWELSSGKIYPNKWSDAVFAVKGAGGIEIHSLIVVPECESPHARTADFVAYIDEIELSASAAPRLSYTDYPLNYEETQVSGKSANFLNSISLNGSADGNQTIAVGSRSPQLIYRPMLEKSFTAKAGETLTPNFSFSKDWMNGYVYLDRGSDGRFRAELNEDFTIPEGSDLMTYSYVETVENTEGYKSDGTKISGDARNFLNPPAFRVPEDLVEGFYRMRFKVDWGSVDPGGRNTATNDIVSNGGMIVDVRLNIHSDEVTVSRDGGLNGDILTEDGKELVTMKVPFGQPVTIVARPASDNFKIAYVKVRHGHHLDGDSLVHGTPQYIDDYFPAYLFKDNKLTLPAECIDGEVRIEPYFVDPGLVAGEDYARNFADDLVVTRTDRRLNSLTFNATQGGRSVVTIPSGTNYVYRDLTGRKQVSVVPGDEVTVAVSYNGGAMHHYLYVDFDNDGHFDCSLNGNGTPAVVGELLSYTYYNQHNSLGESITGAAGSVPVTSVPKFVIPANLPTGVYRARFKTDWNNIDPAGQWSEGGSNRIDANGGNVVDFLLNVHEARQTLTVLTTNGSVYGASNAALPLALPPFKNLVVVPTPVGSGFVAEKMTIRHGHHFDGPQYVRGNRQWSEYEVPAKRCTLPADSVNGDVIISVDFVPGADAEYNLVFSDEFNAPDGTRPDAKSWTCSPRYSSTWNRWIADDERVAFLQGGQFVARAIPNPDKSKYAGDMITGAIQTSGRFSFKYGKIEARILTNPHTGNFPAFWLMPDDQSTGWPNCGEIDIWEQIDNQSKAYHTLHTGYATSMYSTNEACTTDRYHTFGFEWDAESMKWYLDGKQVGRYDKASNPDPRSWPFDKPYYIILNQSVGNGSWAANADIYHTYETRFDWVRVYQKNPQTGISDLAVDSASTLFYDLQGRIVTNPEKGGIYICDGKKVIY